MASCHFELASSNLECASDYRQSCHSELTPAELFLAESFDGNEPQWIPSMCVKINEDIEDITERFSHQLRTRYSQFFQLNLCSRFPLFTFYTMEARSVFTTTVVEFVHRSVLDFLRDENTTSELLCWAETPQRPFISLAMAATIKQLYIQRFHQMDTTDMSRYSFVRAVIPAKAIEAFSGHSMTSLKNTLYEMVKSADLSIGSLLDPVPSAPRFIDLHGLEQCQRDCISLWPFAMCHDVDYV